MILQHVIDTKIEDELYACFSRWFAKKHVVHSTVKFKNYGIDFKVVFPMCEVRIATHKSRVQEIIKRHKFLSIWAWYLR